MLTRPHKYSSIYILNRNDYDLCQVVYLSLYRPVRKEG